MNYFNCLYSKLNQPLMPDLKPMLAEIFQDISTEPMVWDLIIQKIGLSSGKISSSILQLELLELVTQSPGIDYQKN